MAAHQLAQGLASLGRGGDSVLVHMQPHEVAGLQALAETQGTSLTINPHTGLPEAFSLGGFFKNLLPTIAGAALTGLSGGAINPLTAGLITGAATGVVTKDPMQALMGGLGGFGGAGLGQSLFDFGGAGASEGAANAARINAGQNLAEATVPTAAETAAQTGLMDTVGQNAATMGQGISNAFADPSAFAEHMGGWGNTAMKVGAPIAMAGLGALEPSDLGYGTADSGSTTPEEDKYDPNRRLRIPGNNLNLGTLAYAEGGSIGQGGIYDLYGASDSSIGTMNGRENNNLSQDGYGLGKLDRMASGGFAGYAAGGYLDAERPMMIDPSQMQQGLGFAKGGYLDGPGDGMSDSIHATIEGKQPARLADGEFVVPADVVSHLGNGSSKAGAKNLYKMMDKVRQARTGNKKQGKQINPNKYMPA